LGCEVSRLVVPAGNDPDSFREWRPKYVPISTARPRDVVSVALASRISFLPKQSEIIWRQTGDEVSAVPLTTTVASRSAENARCA